MDEVGYQFGLHVDKVLYYSMYDIVIIQEYFKPYLMTILFLGAGYLMKLLQTLSKNE